MAILVTGERVIWCHTVRSLQMKIEVWLSMITVKGIVAIGGILV